MPVLPPQEHQSPAEEQQLLGERVGKQLGSLLNLETRGPISGQLHALEHGHMEEFWGLPTRKTPCSGVAAGRALIGLRPGLKFPAIRELVGLEPDRVAEIIACNRKGATPSARFGTQGSKRTLNNEALYGEYS